LHPARELFCGYDRMVRLNFVSKESAEVCQTPWDALREPRAV